MTSGQHGLQASLQKLGWWRRWESSGELTFHQAWQFVEVTVVAPLNLGGLVLVTPVYWAFEASRRGPTTLLKRGTKTNDGYELTTDVRHGMILQVMTQIRFPLHDEPESPTLNLSPKVPGNKTIIWLHETGRFIIFTYIWHKFYDTCWQIFQSHGTFGKV